MTYSILSQLYKHNHIAVLSETPFLAMKEFESRLKVLGIKYKCRRIEMHVTIGRKKVYFKYPDGDTKGIPSVVLITEPKGDQHWSKTTRKRSNEK